MTNVLESVALRTQDAAGRAWTDLQNATPSQKAEMQANYDAAAEDERVAYAAWKGGQ